MFLSLVCPGLISQLHLIFVPLCSARFLLSRWVERVGRLHQPYTPRPSQAATRYRSSRLRAKQPPSIAPRDHTPSCSQVSLFTTACQAQCAPTRRPPSVGQSGHPRTLWVSLDPSGLKRPHLYVAFILQTACTTTPLNCFPAGITSAHEQAGRISPTIPLWPSTGLSIVGLESSLVSTGPSADKRSPYFPSRLRLSHQGTKTKSLCPVCVGVQRREISFLSEWHV